VPRVEAEVRCSARVLAPHRAGVAGVARPGVAGQGGRGGQHAVLLDQLGDPGPGHAQLAADLGVGQALSCPGAGLPQLGRAEQRRAAHLAGQAPGAVLAVAGADPRHLGGQDAERGGDGLALEAAALGEQIVRSRISRSPAPKADSSIGPACTATTRPSPVRVTVSRQGGGMPGSCWAVMEVSIFRTAEPAARRNRAPARHLGRTPIEREVDC
jgi:hypothetical protein